MDTQFPDTALACLKGIPGIGAGQSTPRSTRTTTSTTRAGNVVFKAASRVLVAQANVPRLQFEAAKRAEQQARHEGSTPRPSSRARSTPTRTFTDVWRRELGSEIVTAEFRGPAHTGGDAVVIFEKANVVHMGDLVFNRLYPFVDRPGGASIRGWIKSLEDSVASYPADAIYIFGHGSSKFGVTGERDDLLRHARLLLGRLSSTSRRRSPPAATSRRSSGSRTCPGFPDFNAPLPNRLGIGPRGSVRRIDCTARPDPP